MEIWKAIKGYEGYYEVSTTGRVRSVDRIITDRNGNKYNFKGRELKYGITKFGYKQVALCINGKAKTIHIHKLVALTFIPNPDHLPCINHKDEVKTNNNVDNLEWCTFAYNLSYGTARQRGAENSRKKVVKIDVTTLQPIEVFESVTDAKKDNPSSVHCLDYPTKCKATNGFTWLYLDDYEINGINRNDVVEKYKRNIYQIDPSNGGILNKFTNVTEAANTTSISPNVIYHALHNGRVNGGYIWQYTTEYNPEYCQTISANYNIKIQKQMEKEKRKQAYQEQLLTMVQQIDPKTNEVVAEYFSTRKAAKAVNGDNSTIAKACKKEGKMCKGFYWRYSKNV